MAKILLFYTGEDAFNFYADRLAEEFINKGNNVFILDTNVDNAKPGHTLSEFESFRNNGIDMAICYNGLGIMTINSTDNTFVYNNVIDRSILEYEFSEYKG